MVNQPLAVLLASGENGLAALRGLAEAQIPTLVLVASKRELALYSRYGRKEVLTGGGDLDGSLVRRLQQLPTPAVIIPTNDFYVSVLDSSDVIRRGGWSLAMPSADVLARILDKGVAGDFIAVHNFPAPKTVGSLPPTPAQLLDRLPLPIVFKPRTDAWKKVIQHKTVTAYSALEVAEVYATYRTRVEGLMAQEYIPGSDDQLWECMCVFGPDSDLRSVFTFRKLYTSPAHFGVTSLGVGETNPSLVRQAAEIGKALGYTGPADFDFKYDHRDGQYKYLEVNPRLGMCNSLAQRSGVNIVLDTYLAAAGRPMAGGRQRDGVVYLNLHDDLLARLRVNQRPDQILAAYRGLVGRRIVGAYFSVKDPIPGVVAARRRLAELIRSVARAVARFLRPKGWGRGAGESDDPRPAAGDRPGPAGRSPVAESRGSLV